MDVVQGSIEFIQGMDPVAAICLVVGIILIVIEMFTPGFAIPGISGIILLLFAIILTAQSFSQGLVMFLVLLSILTILLIIVVRSATKGALFKSPLVNKKVESVDEGYIGVKDMKVFVGKSGQAITPLRPAGTCDFDGVRLDVVTEGDFIDKGNEVTIMKVEGRRIVVTNK